MLLKLRSVRRITSVDVQVDRVRFSETDERKDATLILDLNSVAGILPSLPKSSWRLINSGLEFASPLCRRVGDLVAQEVDNTTRVLYELEVGSAHNPSVDLVSEPVLDDKQAGSDNDAARSAPMPSCADAATPHHPFVIPTIVVVLCDPSPRDISNCLPYQDASFGRRLAVPGYDTMNLFFPPMATNLHSAPADIDWEWNNGHWKAIVPSLKDQATRLSFAKPSSIKKKRKRTPVLYLPP